MYDALAKCHQLSGAESQEVEAVNHGLRLASEALQTPATMTTAADRCGQWTGCGLGLHGPRLWPPCAAGSGRWLVLAAVALGLCECLPFLHCAHGSMVRSVMLQCLLLPSALYLPCRGVLARYAVYWQFRLAQHALARGDAELALSHLQRLAEPAAGGQEAAAGGGADSGAGGSSSLVALTPAEQALRLLGRALLRLHEGSVEGANADLAACPPLLEGMAGQPQEAHFRAHYLLLYVCLAMATGHVMELQQGAPSWAALSCNFCPLLCCCMAVVALASQSTTPQPLLLDTALPPTCLPLGGAGGEFALLSELHELLAEAGAAGPRPYAWMPAPAAAAAAHLLHGSLLRSMGKMTHAAVHIGQAEEAVDQQLQQCKVDLQVRWPEVAAGRPGAPSPRAAWPGAHPAAVTVDECSVSVAAVTVDECSVSVTASAERDTNNPSLPPSPPSSPAPPTPPPGRPMSGGCRCAQCGQGGWPAS